MEPRTVSLDIAFDRKSVLKEPEATHSILRFGFTVPDDEGNPVALAGSLYPKSELIIVIYDLTEPRRCKDNRPRESEVEEMSLRLGFQKARIQDHGSPLPYKINLSPIHFYDRFVIHPVVSPSGSCSTVFDVKGPAWSVHPVAEDPKTFPQNQLQRARKPPVVYDRLIHKGHFFYSLALNVKLKCGTTKFYRVDPEMVVDSNGIGGGDPSYE